VDRWAAALPAAAWTRIDVRDAHHGPWVVELAMTRVVAKTDRKWLCPEEVLVAMRVTEPCGTLKYDDYLSNAAPDTPRRLWRTGGRYSELRASPGAYGARAIISLKQPELVGARTPKSTPIMRTVELFTPTNHDPPA
jgi:hypothetical protein